MERIEKSIEVEVPLRTAYNQWTQFEEFPKFMEGVEEVRQIDENRLFWRAKIAGKETEWDAEIFWSGAMAAMPASQAGIAVLRFHLERRCAKGRKPQSKIVMHASHVYGSLFRR